MPVVVVVAGLDDDDFDDDETKYPRTIISDNTKQKKENRATQTKIGIRNVTDMECLIIPYTKDPAT